MSRTGTFEAPSVHVERLSGLRRKRARAALDRVLWTVRWHLKQRRPRPAWGDHAIDYLVSGAHNVLLIALLVAIGG